MEHLRNDRHPDPCQKLPDVTRARCIGSTHHRVRLDDVALKNAGKPGDWSACLGHAGRNLEFAAGRDLDSIHALDEHAFRRTDDDILVL